MSPIQITKITAGVHVALVAAGVYYAVRVHNFTPLSELPNTDMTVFSALAFPPALAALIGLWLARGEKASRLLAIGQCVGLLVFAVAFAMVLASDEPLAPLLLVVASLWLAVGFAVLLLFVWLVGRSASAGAG
ncbi:hypothetical protein [Hyphomicrobium sp. LHD-15]|uniref:hypothetical protein n=1 Tax=Hyphomicrobium sp. LHD-15 TaxID=3072142 RepID=UPI00280ECE6A|nr:hypothetical protein [Hyphomicrobium sp. LHD-15]MDQ8700131.1 hypothetical protein [Hyphomicrobium sp. LHD-15]